VSTLRRRFDSLSLLVVGVSLLGVGAAAVPDIAVAGAVACDVSWANTAVSGSWGDSTKWNPNVLPDSTKNTCLPPGTYTVTIPADDANISTWVAKALDVQAGATLVLQSDESNTNGLNATTLTVTNDITVVSGTIQIGTGSGIHGTTKLASTSGTLHVDGNGTELGLVDTRGVGNQLDANVSIGTFGGVLGQLSLAITKFGPTITNAGSWGTPTQGQTISSGSFTTSGSITGQGELAMVGGTFDHTAGVINPFIPVRLVGVTSFKPRSTGGGTFLVSELGNVLASDIAANEVVVVEGGLNGHNGELTSSASRANNGTLTLRSSTATNVGKISFSSGTLTNNGTLQTEQGSAPTAPPAMVIEAPLNNAGDFNVFYPTVFDQAAAGITQSAGTSTLTSSLNMTGSAAQFTINGGTLRGSGSITGNVSNLGGTVSPGSSPAALSISGNYQQTLGGTLAIEIGGTGIGSESDRLNVIGTANLGGTLQLLLINSFVPGLTFTYDPLIATGIVGTFNTTNGLAIPGGKSFNVGYPGTSVHLGVLSTGPQRQPDGQIAIGIGSYVGNNIYNLTAAGQSKSKTVASGKKVTFMIKIQNDGGGAKDKFTVHATGSAVTGFTIKYLKGTTNITTAVNNGTFQVTKVAPGGSVTIKAVVTVGSSAAHGASVTRLVTITSGNDPGQKDTVKLTAGRT
jgi:hypothetical protein